MKISGLLVIICFSVITSNVYATVTCEKPRLSKPTEKNHSIYHFKAVVKCNLVDEKIDLIAIKDAYRNEIMQNGSQFVVHSQHDYDNKKGMTGYWLDTTQSYQSEHGPLKVRAEFLLLDNTTTNFELELRSKSVSGKNESSLTKFILNEVALQVLPDRAELVVTKEIDVEEPWYAPHGTFISKVEKELVDSIRKAATLQVKKICGEKVDALRK